MTQSKVTTVSYLNNLGERIEQAKTFIYEVSTYKHYKNRAECVNSKFIKSPTPIKIKASTISRKEKDYILTKDIVMIAAPIEYIKENRFKLFELNTKKHEKAASRRISTR